MEGGKIKNEKTGGIIIQKLVIGKERSESEGKKKNIGLKRRDTFSDDMRRKSRERGTYHCRKKSFSERN